MTRLHEFADSVLPFDLRPWQLELCAFLENLTLIKGGKIVLETDEPQAGLSCILSRIYPAWLAGAPSRSVDLFTYRSTNSERFVEEIDRLMRSPAFCESFPPGIFGSRKKASINARTFGGGLTGVGLGQFVLLDDIFGVPREDRENGKVCDSAISWIESTLQPRVSLGSTLILAVSHEAHRITKPLTIDLGWRSYKLNQESISVAIEK